MTKPVVLTIAGSDNSAGAGAQADLKVISAHGCYGLTAITCVVAEVPGKVAAIQPIRPEIVSAQIRLSFESFPIAAVKTGMLYSPPIIRAVAKTLSECSRKSRSKPILIVDPVMMATSGEMLCKQTAISTYKKWLFPMAELITPNLDELHVLSGYPCQNLKEMKQAGRFLSAKFSCAILLKGGHLRGKTATDTLVNCNESTEFSDPFVHNVSTHGTGCAYAAAIASNRAKGMSLPVAVARAKSYLTETIKQHLQWGKTYALEHFPE